MRASDVFLDSLRDELSQGDVVDLCPAGAISDLRVVRFWPGKEAPPEASATVYSHPSPANLKRPPTPPLFKKEPEMTLFETRLRRCVIVSHDCVAIDKSTNRAATTGMVNPNIPWHVAPIEAWPAETQTVRTQDGHLLPLGDLIAAEKIHRMMELPAHASLPRSYVDFKLLTPVKPAWFANVARLASMTEGGRARLWAKAFRYFSARRLPTSFDCPHCHRELTLADLDPRA